jgi:microcystin-dependent protein
MDDHYIGQIQLLPTTTSAPIGWLKCDGSIYDIAKYNALYALISTRFGTNVPNLTGVSPIPGMDYYIGCAGVFPSRS